MSNLRTAFCEVFRNDNVYIPYLIDFWKSENNFIILDDDLLRFILTFESFFACGYPISRPPNIYQPTKTRPRAAICFKRRFWDINAHTIFVFLYIYLKTAVWIPMQKNGQKLSSTSYHKTPALIWLKELKIIMKQSSPTEVSKYPPKEKFESAYEPKTNK